MEKLRLEITKGEEVRYISHLDVAGAWEKAVRRAKLPVAYSEGFNPHMKISFASALPLGVTGAAEYMDLELNEKVPLAEAMERLQAVLPSGFAVRAASYMPPRTGAMMALISLAEYEIKLDLPADKIAAAQASIAAFNDAANAPYTKVTPKSRREIDLKDFITQEVVCSQTETGLLLRVYVKVTAKGSVKPGEFLAALTESFALPPEVLQNALCCRQGLYVEGEQPWMTPLEL